MKASTGAVARRRRFSFAPMAPTARLRFRFSDSHFKQPNHHPEVRAPCASKDHGPVDGRFTLRGSGSLAPQNVKCTVTEIPKTLVIPSPQDGSTWRPLCRRYSKNRHALTWERRRPERFVCRIFLQPTSRPNWIDYDRLDRIPRKSVQLGY